MKTYLINYTQTALFELTNDLSSENDNRKYAGISGSALDLICSYLNNQWQLVSANGVQSLLAELKISVPQGSVLGPYIF